MVEPANCTLKPLRTPLFALLLVVVPPAELTCEAPDRTPSEADVGACVTLVEKLRSN